MHSIKTKALLWVSLCGALALGACVDTNVAKPAADDDGGDGPCGKGADGKDIDPITMNVFGAATGTPVLYPENKPPAVPDVFLTIPDKDGDPSVISEFSEGALTTADFCPGKDYEVTAWLSSDFKTATNKLGTLKTPVVAEDKPFLIVAGGLIKANVAERHKVDNVAFTLFSVDTSGFAKKPDDKDPKESVDDPSKTQLIVVHASVLLGEPVVVDVGAKLAAATLVKRFTASAPIDLAAADLAAPGAAKAVKLAFTAGTDTKTVTIGPRFPTGTKGVAILFDSLDNDEKVTGKDIPDPSSSLFLTSDDPLLSALPATGVTFPVDE